MAEVLLRSAGLRFFKSGQNGTFGLWSRVRHVDYRMRRGACFLLWGEPGFLSVLFCLGPFGALRWCRTSVDAEFVLELFEGYAFRLWVEEEDDEELQDHHGGEESEGGGFGVSGDPGEES